MSWYYDWNPSAVADKTSETVKVIYQETEKIIERFAPLPPAPAATPDPTVSPNPLEAPNPQGPPDPGPENIEQYISALQNHGLRNQFAMTDVHTFYENNVPVDFLNDLKSKDRLHSLTFSDIVYMYKSQ